MSKSYLVRPPNGATPVPSRPTYLPLPVLLEGVSGHRLEGSKREADLAVRLLEQSDRITEEVKDV